MRNLLLTVLFAFVLVMFVQPSWAAPETSTPAPSIAGKAAATTAATPAKININKASSAELRKLPGIGAVTADEIVAYRAKHGNFRFPNDLLAVKGIGKKTLEKIKTQVTTEEK